MIYQDKTLVCKTCSKEFVFTAGEQEFYASRNLTNEPRTCKECRAQRSAPRELVEITCSQCGQKAQVPHPKMTLCSECYKASKNK